MKQIGHFIGGKEVAGKSGRNGDVFNPATGEKSAQVSLASKAELDAAVEVAKQAFPGWSNTPPLARARILFKYKDLIEKHHDDLARCITLEHGKTFDDAKGEVVRGLEVVEFACGIPHLLKGDFTENVSGGIDT